MQLSHIIVSVGLGLGIAGAASADGLRVPVGDLGRRQAAVILELFQDFGIELIHETLSPPFQLPRNIVAQRATGCHAFATL